MKVAEKSVYERIIEALPTNEKEIETPAGMVKVKRRIAFSDMITLVNLIVNMCTDEHTGEVKWEFYDFAVKSCVTAAYCGDAIPDNLDVVYASVCGVDGLYRSVCDAIDPDQLTNIWHIVRDKLESRDKLNQSTAVGKLNQFLESVDELMKAVGSVSENFDGNEALAALQSLGTLVGVK